MSDDSANGVADAEALDAFFLQIHKLAEEISVTGLKANPVFALFSALA